MKKEKEEYGVSLPDQEADDSVRLESVEVIQDQNNEYRENCE